MLRHRAGARWPRTRAQAELSVGAFARKVDSVRAQAGDRFSQIEFNILIQTLTVTDNPSAELERLRGEIGPLADPWFASPMVYVGSVDEIADKMRQVRERVGVSYFVVFEPAMGAFAPIIERLSGT